jgi:DNA-binding MurR/RpiR family transcriptional regulator
MEINEILKMYNEDGLTLVEIAGKLSSSKSTISRVLHDHGYIFNKALKQYIHETANTNNNETVNTGNNETAKNVSRETIKTVNCTFALPEKLAKALKVKSAVEGVKMVEIVRKSLESTIEDKYFDM